VPTEEPEEHVHEPAEAWSQDEQFHWHACGGCEELLDKAEHDMTWTETRPAALGAAGEEEGVCSVCGYKTTRVLPALEPETKQGDTDTVDGAFGVSPQAFRMVVYGIFGATGLGLIALIVIGIVKRSRR
jgi:hypothetical protein